MILAALELEVDQYVHELHQLRDELDHAMVVRNGHAQERTVCLGAGTIRVRAPRVDDRRPRHQFTSKILPPYMRRLGFPREDGHEDKPRWYIIPFSEEYDDNSQTSLQS